MITKCRDITNRINELENQINNISKPTRPVSNPDGTPSSGNSHHLSNRYGQRQTPSSAPQDCSSTSIRVKLAQHMINQMQGQINKNNKCQCVPAAHTQKIYSMEVAENRTLVTMPSNKFMEESDSFMGRTTRFHFPSQPSQKSNCKPMVEAKLLSNHTPECHTSEANWKQSMIKNRNVTFAEKESDAFNSYQNDTWPVPLSSVKNPPSTNDKPFCGCMYKNSFNLQNENMKNEDQVIVGRMINSSGGWCRPSCYGITPIKLESALTDDKKAMDNFLIDSLRGEIEKVRYKLGEIGSRPNEDLEELILTPSKDKTSLNDTPCGDYHNQSLLEELKTLQQKNEELSQQLAEHKKLQDSSMKKAQDATTLLNTYEAKVNELHEQALKSAEMMAKSKEKFCSILSSRNCQIKNLHEVNIQLKKAISTNGEKMKQLSNNYKLLKTRFKELEDKDRRYSEENFKLRDNMRKLEKELKVVYGECSALKGENMKFLNDLHSVKEEVTDKYNTKLNKHKVQIEELWIRSKKSEDKIVAEVKEMSEQLHCHGSQLEEMKLEVNTETSELNTKYRRLLYQYEALVRKFQEYEQFDEIKCTCIEQELREFSVKMKEKESIIVRERDELRTLVEELALAIKHNKTAIHELTQTNDQQGTEIDKLNKIIKSKDEKMVVYQNELATARLQCEHARKEMEALKDILQKTEKLGHPEQERLLHQLETVRQDLSLEKDNNLIKQKVIEDQGQSIRYLKEELDNKAKEIQRTVESLCRATEETHRLSEHLRFMEAELNNERQRKQNLIRELEDMEHHKASLTKQVEDLESAVKNHCGDENVNQKSQQNVIYKLEQQMKRQKQDWEMHRKTLQRDKEKALHAARFASQKLLDTVNDFQRQMFQQKAAQSKLAMLLQGKEKQLDSLTLKVQSLLPTPKIPRKNKHSSLDNRIKNRNICASFCQLKQIYQGPDRVLQSEESSDEADSRSYAMTESNFCSAACCNGSDG